MPRPRPSSLFDIRTIVGTLLLIYGIVLLVVGLVSTGQVDLDKADGINVNLWTGIGLVVVGGAFLLWVRLRPVAVPEGTDVEDQEENNA